MPSAFRHLKLERPLAVVDLETTGVDPRHDRIVEVGVLKVAPDAGPIRYRRLVHPGVPIPPAARAVHGIGDEDVAEQAAIPGDRPPAGPVAGGRRPGRVQHPPVRPAVPGRGVRPRRDRVRVGRSRRAGRPAALPPPGAPRPGGGVAVLLRPRARRRARGAGRRRGDGGDPRCAGRPLRGPAGDRGGPARGADGRRRRRPVPHGSGPGGLRLREVSRPPAR